MMNIFIILVILYAVFTSIPRLKNALRTDRRMDGRMDGRTDRWMDGRMQGCTD